MQQAIQELACLPVHPSGICRLCCVASRLFPRENVSDAEQVPCGLSLFTSGIYIFSKLTRGQKESGVFFWGGRCHFGAGFQNVELTKERTDHLKTGTVLMEMEKIARQK